MTDEYEDADLNINWDDVGVTFFYGAGRWLTGPSKKDLGNHSGEETLRDYALGCAEAETWNTKWWADRLARLDKTSLGPLSEQNHGN